MTQDTSSGPAGRGSFTRRQWLTLLVFGLVDICQAICLSIQAPFFPSEAESKGVSASQYGIVFGMFELTKCAVCPLLGKYIHKLGPKNVFNGGIFATSTSAIVFGLLDMVGGTGPFLGLCFAVRMIEAAGYAAFLTASFTIIAREFPDNVATIFASLETCFGIGLIFGPLLGSVLYQVGGYTVTFASMGSLLFCMAIFTAFTLPGDEKNETRTERKGGLLRALAVPDIAMAAFSIICASCSNGFVMVLLEPHLRPLSLRPLVLGVMFVITGAVYATCAPVWGALLDRHVPPKLITATGAVLVVVGFSLLGPAPFLPIQPSVPVIAVALVVFGVGFGAEVVAAFVDAHRQAVRHGFPDNVETYGTISGLWASMFALGAFVGPCLAGVLYDQFGFQYASLMIIVVHAVLLLAVALFVCLRVSRHAASLPSAPTSPIRASQTPLLEREIEKTPLLCSEFGSKQHSYGSDNHII